ncbi:MAG TPA: signal peptidase I [Thermoanaerobaculia bacterium]|nr:signal peptidase I [Thermoanaerobaculia bacterium]
MEPSLSSSPPKSRRRMLVWIVLAIAGVLLLRIFGADAIRAHVVQAYRIPSGSMEPTIQIGDHILVSKRAYRDQAPQRGDLVVYRFPEDPRREFIGRVAAVGGDRIEIRDKKLFINGQVVEEPYAVHNDPETLSASPLVPFNRRDQMTPQPVPEGSYFVLGDNRDNSNDSRFWGPVDGALITGRPQSVYWSRNPETGEIRWDRIGRALD